MLCVVALVAIVVPFNDRFGYSHNDTTAREVDIGKDLRTPTPPKTEFTGRCLPSGSADGAKIYLLGAYEGGTKTPLSLADEDNEVGTIAIGANDDGPPMIVVVSAYDPVVWDFRKVPKARLRAVVAYGYSSQAVAGVSTSTPVQFVSYNKSNPDCGTYAYAYEGGSNLDTLAEIVSQITGRKVDQFQGAYDPKGFHLEGGVAPEGQFEGLVAAGMRSTQNVTRDDVPPGSEGLTELINLNKLRLANAADVAALSRALTKTSPTGDLAPVRPSLPGIQTYVVLAATTLPKGMYGANSATFLIPQGIPMPHDPGSHNTYYALADGGCVGPMCGRRE
jgi:hypothetical protein